MEELCRKILQKRGNFGLRFRKNAYLCIAKKVRGVAQLVSAPRSGRGGRKFESSHPDLSRKAVMMAAFFFAANYGNPLFLRMFAPIKT